MLFLQLPAVRLRPLFRDELLLSQQKSQRATKGFFLLLKHVFNILVPTWLPRVGYAG